MHYISLKKSIIKPTRPKQAIKDLLFNMLSFGSHITGSSNSVFAEILKKKFIQYHFAGIFIINIIVNA